MPVDNTPVAVDDSFTIDQDTVLNADISTNDSGLDVGNVRDRLSGASPQKGASAVITTASGLSVCLPVPGAGCTRE